ncbi:MAG: WYL domain-containing protein [Candidatus Thermoplasmatota archaeon]|nr:WYL domain-containing protein [Candidatus Thermoplasmatota archaeon]
MDYRIDYSPPGRDLKLGKSSGIQWNLSIPDDVMRSRSEYIFLLDPMLDYDSVASMVMDRYGNLSCRFCYSPLVRDGKNGSGTVEFLCRKCRRKMSLYNAFELITFRYRKELTAFLSYIHCSSSGGSASLYGLGKDLFNEMRMSLPEIHYSRKGEPDTILYDGTEYGIVTIDMMYKGHRGLMLGVSGDLKFGNFGNEDSGDGLDEFFSTLEAQIHTDRIIFLMDMKMSVAHKILDKWKDRAIIILQSHRTWGDVFVYFHREEWFTLHLRTDAFSTVSVKRDESSLLPPGIMELFSGLKGVTHRNPMRRMSEDEIRRIAHDCMDQVRSVDWNVRGRVDFVMASKLRDLNAALKELRRRKSDTGSLVDEIENILSDIKEAYRRRINRSVKKKIVNAWKSFSMLKGQINDLSMALLGEGIKDKAGSGKISDRNVRMSDPPRLVYKGPVDNGPSEMKWITDLLYNIFSGKEITTNACEGTFGNMGTLIRSGRSILLERALTKNMLYSGSATETVSWFNENYPMNDMGRRAERNHRRKLIVGRSYKITYQDRSTVKTERIIDVRERKRKYIIAYCHLRNAVRTFKRSRIKTIELV